MNTQPANNLFPALQPLLIDSTIDEIIVEGWARVSVHVQGTKGFNELTSPYKDESHLRNEIAACASATGHMQVDGAALFDMWLNDGLHVIAVLPPVSPLGAVLHIHKPHRFNLNADDLVRFGAWSAAMVEFLKACVHARLNILIVGGANSGKTTVLNTLASMIEPHERIIILGGELLLQQPRALVLVPQTLTSGSNTVEISSAYLMHTATEMKPDRLIVTELKGTEVVPFIEALHTGHDGALATVTAKDTRSALGRLEILATMGNSPMPRSSLRELLTSGIDIIINQQYQRDGVRRMLSISEITGIQNDIIQTHDIFKFQTTEEKGHVGAGRFMATGIIPACAEKLSSVGIDPETFFLKDENAAQSRLG